MLAWLQRGLERLYRIELKVRVGDFLCRRPELLPRASRERGESLFVAAEPDGVGVLLYVDAGAMRRLARTKRQEWLLPERFRDFCLLFEGISHFVYLAHRIQQGRSVTEMELELQAEVDKYLAAVLGEVSPADARSRLFENVEYLDGPQTEAGARYRLVNSLATRYARHLERKYLGRRDLPALLNEVRRFFRLDQAQKLAAIPAWG